MKLLEYQSKELLRRYGVPLPRSGGLVRAAGHLGKALKELGRGPWVLKSQVFSGGRGAAGGIRLVRTAQEAACAAGELLGKRLVTAQNAPEGETVRALWVEGALEISRELYVSVSIHRGLGRPVFTFCAEGGVEIERLARESPEKIRTAVLEEGEFRPHQLRGWTDGLELPSGAGERFQEIVGSLIRIFMEQDASTLEINPLIWTAQGEWVALDAKVILDDNALYRHPEYLKLAQKSEEYSKAERKALEAGISYVSMDGEIGCMVNGAGLAMATLDMIHLAGGRAANFLDVGGGADAQQVRRGFELLLSDRKVRAVLVNIFGGILRCDVVARGLLDAFRKLRLGVPLVMRLEGTRVEEGRKLLGASGLSVIGAETLADAAQRAVAAARKV
ncbi:MAG: ADP-forming succinate--CoA ligase subunit beta [Elusimicrobia bacterium]|nr:ADP-forming succinate--CoA ligase subunit beta [Elusimicrobiota bacterium]